MWIIVVIIVIIVVYSIFSKATDTVIDNTKDNFEQDKWYMLGALADMHNKKKKQ